PSLGRPPGASAFPSTTLFRSAYTAWLEERRSQAEITILDPALRAMDRLAAGDLEGAEAAFRQAIAADPQNAYLHGLVAQVLARQDRKSTRLNSSHVKISYAVF